MFARLLYTLALYLAAPLAWLWMAKRARKAGGEWGILAPQRFGRYDGPAARARPVWVHAVSLGETRAAQPLVRALLDRGLPVLLTHATPTGRAEGERLFPAAMAGGRLLQAWLPYDFPGAVRGFMRHFRPRCGVLIEREIWPNLLARARVDGVPMVLASARFSEASLRQSRWLGAAMHDALAGLHAVLAQTETDARRLRAAGAREPRVAGNLKFDLVLPAAPVAAGRAWRKALDRPVVAIASTREGEDARFVDAIARADARALFLLIPRHPQRFDEAADRLSRAGLRYVRRSTLAGSGGTTGPVPAGGAAMPDMVGPEVRVVLGDTLGEMPFHYAACDVAIVAGSFAPFGGQNLIEACAAGAPVIVGPHTRNFEQAAEDAIAAGAALRVADAEAAVQTALRLLGDQVARGAMRQAAEAWIAHHGGAAQRVMEALPLDDPAGE